MFSSLVLCIIAHLTLHCSELYNPTGYVTIFSADGTVLDPSVSMRGGVGTEERWVAGGDGG